MPILFISLLLIFVLLLCAFFVAFYEGTIERISIAKGLDATLFLIMMPQYEPAKEGVPPTEEKAIIAQMEQVLANFLNLKKQSASAGWGGRRMFQPRPSVALEIASRTGGSDISFYIAVPRHLEGIFEKYVHGIYPKAVVEKVPADYTVFEPHGKTAGAWLKLKDNFLFPINTYQYLEKDPVSAITNTLSKIKADEGAAIQVIIRPSPLSLRSIGEKALKKIREGKSSKSAAREALKGEASKMVRELFKDSLSKKRRDNNLQNQSATDEAGYEAIQSKISKRAFEANIRLVSSAPSQERADDILEDMLASFSQFSLSAFNGFVPFQEKGAALRKFVYEFSFRTFNPRQKIILNVEELSSLYHFPTHHTQTPYIKSAKSRSAPPPADLPAHGMNVLGKVLFRGEQTQVSFASREDRRRHFYIIGQTGTGKSTLLREMIRQDIAQGEGVAVIDPHGELIEHTLANIPKNRVDDVVVFEPFDTMRPMGLNMLEYETPEQKDFAVQEMVAIFYKLFPPEIIGPMFEHYMRNAMLALMADQHNPGTLVEIPKMFTDPAFLQQRLAKVSDMVVRNFWTKEWAQTTGSTRSDMLGYVVSKVGRFIENEMMRNIIGQSRSSFDLSKIMDEGKIFLANLSKGQTGEVNSSLLGLILVSKMQMAAMKRARTKEADRKDFYLYVDEFQNFTTDSIATILSEARKYKLNLILAHQYIPQLTDQIKNAVLGNVGSIGAFRISAEDAEFLEKQFEPEFSRYDLVNLDNFNLVMKMMLNNKTSTPFKMEIYPPRPGRQEIVDPIKKISKLKYGKPKAIVEEDIARRSFFATSESNSAAQSSAKP